jgi:hypothetical protein
VSARWRNVEVRGEQEYRNKGLAYCPHCGGPLFKGERVAVIGGGNSSGVQAAIDRTGVVGHVTLIEFADPLEADAILVNTLRSMPDVEIHSGSQTTEISGADGRVNGLVYKDRASGEIRRVPLGGVFVQIGLVPNTEWLRGTVDLSKYGGILIDDKCATSLPGVLAAGDVTTVPHQQIIIAGGEGSKAAVSGFDHPIRSLAPAGLTAWQAQGVRSARALWPQKDVSPAFNRASRWSSTGTLVKKRASLLARAPAPARPTRRPPMHSSMRNSSSRASARGSIASTTALARIVENADSAARRLSASILSCEPAQ